MTKKLKRIAEPTAEQEQAWREWLAERPPAVRAVAERFDPWSLYRMKSTGQRVTVASFFEDGTISVDVSGRFNFVLHDRNVFGVDPNDLEPCDLPGPDEMLGTMLSPEQVDENIDALRVMIASNFREVGPDGKARRRAR